MAVQSRSKFPFENKGGNITCVYLKGLVGWGPFLVPSGRHRLTHYGAMLPFYIFGALVWTSGWFTGSLIFSPPFPLYIRNLMSRDLLLVSLGVGLSSANVAWQAADAVSPLYSVIVASDTLRPLYLAMYHIIRIGREAVLLA